MADNFARYKIQVGITTSCREQRTLTTGAIKRPQRKDCAVLKLFESVMSPPLRA